MDNEGVILKGGIETYTKRKGMDVWIISQETSICVKSHLPNYMLMFSSKGVNSCQFRAYSSSSASGAGRATVSYAKNKTPFMLGAKESFTIGEKGALKMEMDPIFYYQATRIPVCVLDTKYKAHSTVSNDDYNQIVAYADAVGCENAVLMYPKYPFDEKPGRIRVRTAVFDVGAEIDRAGKKLLDRLYNTLSKK